MKPKLVLHIGMAKTGTSALQARLAGWRRNLASQGVLYPDTGTGDTHEFLVCNLSYETKAPRLMAQRYGRDPIIAQRVFEDSWSKMLAEMEDVKPDKVVLSTEYLFDRLTPEHVQEFRDRLSNSFSDINVVAYVRQPSKRYFSMVQQTLKASSIFRPPMPMRFRTQLETWESVFPGNLQVYAYDRSLMAGGDIATDFLTRLIGIDLAAEAAPSLVNEAISAEAAAILQEFQREFYPDLDHQFTPEKRRLRLALERFDRNDPPESSPSLFPHIARYLDEASTDLLWLRDRYSVIFPGLDYSRIGSFEPLTGSYVNVGDVAPVDNARKRRMQRAVSAGSASLDS